MSAVGSLMFSFGLVAAASPQVATVAPYRCDVEYDNWQVAWTPDWKSWCCEHELRGCPPTTTETTTTKTKTSTTETTTTATTTSATTTPAKGCDAMCFYKGVDSSCRNRIHWAAGHKKGGTAGEKAPCEAAHV
eukprot:CAMPEP_0198543746 /NCGR_PEP_ID=MMETSP1462-20131121/59832_1 /TAXON_ID=1333877 /ORGANISM="Brandtodinium nutriculum, Strain RCC3387" /LENGTH=132 /DNA_ID=CAMNT_0044274037 /DNA_START=69 /DNA_END=463 /DNA_ORIENTATION=+